MNKEDAKNELLYRLCKLVLVNMVRNSMITAEEAEDARRGIQEELRPIIGCLDDGVYYG